MAAPGRFVDAVLIARDLYSRNPILYTSHVPRHVDLGDEAAGAPPLAVRVVSSKANSKDWCVLKAAQDAAKEALRIDNYPIDVVPLSERGMLDKLGEPLFDEDGKVLPIERIMRSILEFRRDRARISYVKSLNSCWTRFVVCKELAHVIMGEASGYFASNLDEQLEMAFEIGSQIDYAGELKREIFALCVAIEIMLPWQTRQTLNTFAAKVDRLTLARLFQVPRKIIDLYYDTKIGYLSEQANRDLDGTIRPSLVGTGVDRSLYGSKGGAA